MVPARLIPQSQKINLTNICDDGELYLLVNPNGKRYW
nr:MAG TPA: hypothetical protein [Caudoviricetes sp.]